MALRIMTATMTDADLEALDQDVPSTRTLRDRVCDTVFGKCTRCNVDSRILLYRKVGIQIRTKNYIIHLLVNDIFLVLHVF